MNATLTVGSRTLDISTLTGRLVAADAVQEEGREAEAALLRDAGGRPWAARRLLCVRSPRPFCSGRTDQVRGDAPWLTFASSFPARPAWPP